MKRLFCSALLLMALFSSTLVTAYAADYDFSTDGTPEYYPSSSYEDLYGSRYNYGGKNLVDYQFPELPYGTFSTTQTGIMEKALLPGLQQSVSGTAGGGIYGVTSVQGGISVDVSTPQHSPSLLPDPVAFTKYSKSFCLSNGAIGRISIPAIGVSRYYVWEGETTSSMNKGLAHFSSTSVWDGNVGICGHNRGAKYVIGSIKDLEPGDKITYTTSQGTRTYEVETVRKIRNDDWSYLEATSDNRITLITCVAGDSSYRWCVQGVQTN